MADEEADVATIAETYASLQPMLRFIICRKYGVPADEAENIIQQIFLDYLIQRERILDRKAWLVGAACHSSRYYWRVQRRSSEQMNQALPQVDPQGVEREYVLRHDFRLLLEQLNARCRQLLRLHYGQGYSLEDLAGKLSTSSSYVKTILHRCRQQARAALERLKGANRDAS